MTPIGSAGRVILVGAGPGDPDLITVRGAEVLRAADAVLFDELVSAELLTLAPSEARLIDVGKRGHDPPTHGQDDINRLLVELAREGKAVVRLKGGDPFVFGRGGEEASYCVAAGVPVEVVPGVSSAVAVPAYAGIPVTDRRFSASFAVVTGHKDPSDVTAATRWDQLATAVDTLIILMGMRNLGEIVERLLEAGRPPDTPSAAISWGTTPQQRIVEAPLGELVKRVREEGLTAPAAVVIGEVVRLRRELSWFETLPLFGRRVLVTRDAERADEMAAALRAYGADPICIPTIEIAPTADPAPLDDAVARLSEYDVVVLASANAARALGARVRARGVEAGSLGLQVVCVGPATASAARSSGLPVHLVPEARFDAAGLLEAIRSELDPPALRCLLPRSEIGREDLAEGLRAAGAVVDVVPAYRTVAPEGRAGELSALLEDGGLDTLTFTSPSAVHNFLAMLTPPARLAAGRCTVAAIGPTTAAALESGGLPADVVPVTAGAVELVAALATHGIGS